MGRNPHNRPTVPVISTRLYILRPQGGRFLRFFYLARVESGKLPLDAFPASVQTGFFGKWMSITGSGHKQENLDNVCRIGRTAL